MKLYEILSNKGSAVFSIEPEASLTEMAKRLVEYNCGSLVVVRHETMLGIVTERDMIKSYVATGQSLDDMTVGDVMTTNVITGAPSDEVSDTMGLMTAHRIRHLPILEDDKLAGMISIGDVVKAQHDELSVENHFMKEYIQG